MCVAAILPLFKHNLVPSFPWNPQMKFVMLDIIVWKKTRTDDWAFGLRVLISPYEHNCPGELECSGPDKQR